MPASWAAEEPALHWSSVNRPAACAHEEAVPPAATQQFSYVWQAALSVLPPLLLPELLPVPPLLLPEVVVHSDLQFDDSQVEIAWAAFVQLCS
jgi:hypothetical protein